MIKIKTAILVLMVLIPTIGAWAQRPFQWTDELNSLKRIDLLPEYRTGTYVESFRVMTESTAMMTGSTEPIPIFARRLESLSSQK